jgi:hypothetical protein
MLATDGEDTKDAEKRKTITKYRERLDRAKKEVDLRISELSAQRGVSGDS